MLESSKSLALFCHIHLPLTANLLIDGWGRYGKWQESLCWWFCFKRICHWAGGEKGGTASFLDHEQAGSDVGDATSAGDKKRKGDDWLSLKDGRGTPTFSFTASWVLVIPSGWNQGRFNEKELTPFLVLIGFLFFRASLTRPFLVTGTQPLRRFLYWQSVLMKCHLRQLAQTIDVPQLFSLYLNFFKLSLPHNFYIDLFFFSSIWPTMEM